MDIDFESYIRGSEPDKKKKASAWKTAIGLQAVDGLQTSDYLKNTAVKHIEGDINIDEVKKLINSYYQSKTARTPEDEETEEADKVSANIARILNEQSFAFSVAGFTSIHRRLFEGIFKFAGKIRDYDITKKEWVLRGDTVLYVNSEDLCRALEYDLEQEKNFSYCGVSEVFADFLLRLILPSFISRSFSALIRSSKTDAGSSFGSCGTSFPCIARSSIF